MSPFCIGDHTINEKHEKAANTNVFSAGRNQWNLDDIRRAESEFRIISQEPPQALSHAAHDADFYQTQIAQRLRAIAKQHGTDVGFFKGTDDGPSGFYRGGRIWVRSNRPDSQLIRSFEHELSHHRNDGPFVSALKKGVDLHSAAAQRVLAAYNGFLARIGKAPLTEDRARQEIVAPFLSGDTRYGDLSTAFNNPERAVKLALNYHASSGSTGSSGGQNPGRSFEPGEGGEAGRERAPPAVKLAGDKAADEAPRSAQGSVVSPVPVPPEISQHIQANRRIPVRRPDGTITTIPAGHLKAALQSGYKQITRAVSGASADSNKPLQFSLEKDAGLDGPIAGVPQNTISASVQSQPVKPASLPEWGKYDLRKVPVGSNPIALTKSFPKSETQIKVHELPKTSGGLSLWAKSQLANLPGVVRSPWGNEVVLYKGSDIADRARQYISCGAGVGPSRDRAQTLPMLANTIQNAMAYASMRNSKWSAYLYRYAGGQLHVVLVKNDRGTVDKQLVAAPYPHDRNGSGDLRVLYRNGIEGRPGETPSGAQPPAPQTILDKVLREVWFQSDIQSAWQQVRSSVTAKEMTDEFNRRKAQGLPTDPAMALEDAAIGRVINSDGRYRIVDNFLETLRTALKQRLKSNVLLTAEPQLKEAALELLRNRTVQAPGLGLVQKGMVPLGQWGETWLSHVLRGRGTKPSNPFLTSLGARYADRVFNGIAHEAKAGFKVKLTDRIRTQILKDEELVALNRFDGVHWHFFRGAEPDVLKFLEQNGIGYTVY